MKMTICLAVCFFVAAHAQAINHGEIDKTVAPSIEPTGGGKLKTKDSLLERLYVNEKKSEKSGGVFIFPDRISFKGKERTKSEHGAIYSSGNLEYYLLVDHHLRPPHLRVGPGAYPGGRPVRGHFSAGKDVIINKPIKGCCGFVFGLL